MAGELAMLCCSKSLTMTMFIAVRCAIFSLRRELLAFVHMMTMMMMIMMYKSIPVCDRMLTMFVIQNAGDCVTNILC